MHAVVTLKDISECSSSFQWCCFAVCSTNTITFFAVVVAVENSQTAAQNTYCSFVLLLRSFFSFFLYFCPFNSSYLMLFMSVLLLSYAHALRCSNHFQCESVFVNSIRSCVCLVNYFDFIFSLGDRQKERFGLFFSSVLKSFNDMCDFCTRL